MTSPSVLILAGRRGGGTLDPLARNAGVSHKCLVPIRGKSLISRVLATVEQALPEAPILISVDGPTVLLADESVARLHASGRLSFVEAQSNILESMIVAGGEAGFPLLITTGDNVLLTTEAVRTLIQVGESGDADAIIVMAPKEQIQAVHSGGKPRYYEFSDGGYSNCNLFWLRSRDSLKAAEPFREGGQFLKVKGRMARTFGLVNALKYKLGLFSLKSMFRSISRRIGVRVLPLVLADGRLAIDVDDAKSYAMVEDILAREDAPEAVTPGRRSAA